MVKNSTELLLPLELLTDIIQRLPLRDQRSLSLTSQLTRKLALRFIFGHLLYTEEVANKIRNIHLAGKDVKAAITKLELVSCYTPDLKNDERNILFQFLQSLPNLHYFSLTQSLYLVRPIDTPKLIASLRQSPLLEFYLNTGFNAKVEGQPTIGLSGLEKLSVIWNRSDHDDQPGSAHDHLYNLVWPSLSTLVDLRIENSPGFNFDLQLLKPAGNTLRSFRFLVVSDDQSILDRIPVLFPHLIKLDIRWCKYTVRHSMLWKDKYINILARNKNLMDLTLSSDFEVKSNDITFSNDGIYAWFVRSYKRRLKATQDLLSACEKLERCCWVQLRSPLLNQADLEHSFIVEEQVLDDKKTRVVRGLKQEWMGRDYYCSKNGEIVKCKLEDLPETSLVKMTRQAMMTVKFDT